MMAEPFSGTNPRALKGTWRYVLSEARTISATPGNHAPPAPTPGPLRARTKIFLWSMIERRSSIPRVCIRETCRYTEGEYLPTENLAKKCSFFSAVVLNSCNVLRPLSVTRDQP